MKLKNSYILLMAMIVLLISIGSACASEDNTDSDVTLASKQTDVVLEDGEDITQEKINTTVNIPESTYTFKDTDTKKISVDVKDNESKSIEITKNDLKVTEGNTTLNFTFANNNLTLSSTLAVGKHSLVITYLGNNTYASSYKDITLNVNHNKTLEMPSTIVSKNGNTVKIPVIVSDGLTNYTVEKGDLKINLTYIDEEGKIASKIIDNPFIENNEIEFPLDISKFIQVNVTVNLTESSSVKKAAIKLFTEVNASDIKIKESDDKNITITVCDGYGNEITVKQSDLSVFEGATKLSIAYTDNIIRITSTLARGNHTLVIKYGGNTTYAESNKTIVLGIYGNSTFDVESSTNVDENNKINLKYNLTDGVDPVDINPANLEITLNYIDENNEAKSTKITSIDINKNSQIITFDVTDKFKKANLTVNYTTDEGKNVIKTVVVKVNTEIIADDEIIKGNTETLNFTANVAASDSFILDVNNNNFKIYNGNKALNATYANGVFTINDKLKYGTYNLTIKFTGNDTYSDASKNVTLKIIGFNTNNVTSVNVNSTKEFEIKLNVTDGIDIYEVNPDDLNVTITYKDGNDTKNVTISSLKIEDNVLSIVLKDTNFTKADMIIKYKDTTQVNITVNRIYNIRIDVINNVAEYQSGNFTFKLVDLDAPETPIANKTVNLEYRVMGGTITFQQTITAKTDENGVVIFNNSKIFVAYFNLVLGIGKNTVTLSGSGFKVTNPSQNVTINKATINITIDNYEEFYGSEEKVKIHVYNGKTGDPMKFVVLHLYMPDSSTKDYYFQTDENGTSQISVNGLVGGTYPITVNNNDTQNMTEANASGNIVIKKIPVVINAKDTKIYYNSGSTATIKITRNGAGVDGVYVLVRLYSTSSKYNDYLFQTNSKGELTFSAPLNVGKHNMIVVLADNRYEASQVTKTITVKKASAKLSAPKVTAYYKQGKYFTVKVTNSKNKKAIYAAKVKISIQTNKVRYKPITGSTGADGKLRLKITLNPGTYSVTVSAADSKNYKASTIKSKMIVKKAPTKLTPKKLTAKKGAKKYFQVKVTNKKTKKAISGVKVKIKVKSKTYTATSNSKGIAKISTKSLKVGTYKVTVTSANKYCTAKTAKSTIKIKR